MRLLTACLKPRLTEQFILADLFQVCAIEPQNTHWYRAGGGMGVLNRSCVARGTGQARFGME